MKKSLLFIGSAVLLVTIFATIGRFRTKTPSSEAPQPSPTSQAVQEAFGLQSPAFSSGGSIPALYTCDGADTRPALTISSVPTEAKSLAIVMYDPDAPGGTFVHWVAWNIPPQIRELPEGPLPVGVMEGTNSFRSVGYDGPCPPGGTHRYIWRLYALRNVLTLDSSTTREDLETAINTYVITQTEFMGRYTKQ